MSQGGGNSSGGGGGGGTITSVAGQGSLVAPTTTVTTVGTTATVENRAWQTQYVVDASATQGLRGTFTTIQAAIDQIVADGGDSFPFHTVFVRPGTYADPIVLPANVGINIIGDGPVDEISTGVTVIISGNISGSASLASFQNLYFQGVIDCTDMQVLSAKDCNIYTINVLTTGGQFNFSKCTINDGTFSSLCSFTNCSLGGSTCVLTGGQINMYGCQLGNVGLSGTPTVFIYDSSWRQAGNIIGDGTFNGSIYVYNCIVPAASALFNNIDDGTVAYSNLTFPMSANVNRIMAASAVPQFLYEVPSFGGNVKPLYKTAVDFTLTRNYCYIGVTDTSSARSITLPPVSPAGDSPYIGQEFEIKDESGGASSNNITVIGTIDNTSNYVINTDYGFLRVRFDGTSYWSI